MNPAWACIRATTGRLIRVMKSLRDKGNTLIVVEHEESVMRAADHLVELGPGRGEAGGELVFNGPAASLLGARPARSARSGAGESSLTAAYLLGEKTIPIPAVRRRPQEWVRIEGAREHNLRNLTVEIPLGVLACVTGVSGSGKSTLVHRVLFENLLRAKGVASENAAGLLKSLHGAERISQVVLVDQSPLARTPKSTPALYLGVFDGIRELFASTPRALSVGGFPPAPFPSMAARAAASAAMAAGSSASRCSSSATSLCAARSARAAATSRTCCKSCSRANPSPTCWS